MWLIGHLVKTAFRAFFRILLAVIVCAVVAGGAALLVSSQVTHQWPPSQLTEVAAVLFAVLAAYAGGLTVLVKEAIHGVRQVEHDVKGAVEQEAEHAAH